MDSIPTQIYPIPITCPVCNAIITLNIIDDYKCNPHLFIRMNDQALPTFWSIRIEFPNFIISGNDVVPKNKDQGILDLQRIPLNHNWNINDLNFIINNAKQLLKFHAFL